jgi:hypothetical protein
MPCERVRIGDTVAIVCSRSRPRVCVGCGRKAADRLCDWKVERDGLDGAWLTCDKPICGRCTYEPATDKDLCPDHAAAWKARLAARENAR